MMPGGAELSEKLPDELFQLVESFKKFIREQKAYKDQKFDVDPILEVDREADELMLAFQRVSVDSDINNKLIQQIKDDTTKLLRHAELAYSSLRSHLTNNPTFQQQQQQQHSNVLQSQSMQSLFNSSGFASSLNNTANNTNQLPNQTLGQTTTFGTPFRSGFQSFSQNNQQNDLFAKGATSPHNQFANTTTAQYFAELADQFELRMRMYGEQIKELKMSLDGIVRTHNAEELFKWLDKQHKSLGEIGAKVYMMHERIMEKKADLEKMNNAQLTNMNH